MTCFSCGLQAITCCNCGVVFGMSDAHYKERLSDKKLFHCPNGHSQLFTGESDADKAKRLKSEADKLKVDLTCCRQSVADAREELNRNRFTLSKRQEVEREWLIDHVKGVGWERATAILKAFGRVRTFAAAGTLEASEELTRHSDRAVSENLAGQLLERTRQAMQSHPLQKQIPSKASVGNAN